jgi:hypothetical protein
MGARLMATTLDAIVDRVRSLCLGPPFEFVESARLDRFDWDAAQQFEDVSLFRVETVSQPARGGTSFTEERTDLVTVTVGRAIHGDYDATRRALLRCSHSLSAAIVRDGAAESGIYTVPDGGFASRVDADPTTAYLAMRLTLPVNYMAQL